MKLSVYYQLNFFNSEAHGGVVTRSFLEKLHLPNFIINGMNINGIYYHPTFLYESLLNLNVTPQQARGVLPMCLKVKMRVTHNIREWFHLLDMRYWGIYGTPHPDFRYCMHKVYKTLQLYYPNIFDKHHLDDQEELVEKYSNYKV